MSSYFFKLGSSGLFHGSSSDSQDDGTGEAGIARQPDIVHRS